MDDLSQGAYSWIPEYLSQRFEPVIVELGDYVEANIDGVEVHVWKPSSKDAKFSSSVAAFLPETEESDLAFVGLNVGCRHEMNMTAVDEGFQMVCYSEFGGLFDYGSRVHEFTLSEGPRLGLPGGPRGAFGFGDTAAVRQQLDQWTDATVEYISDHKALMVSIVEAERARARSKQTEP
jgi:hypothetical protein